MKHIITICISIFFCITAMAQQSHVVAFYNVENLFDTINSPATADEDMLPLADRQWTTEKYKAKLKSISTAIAGIATQHDYPTLMALAEVENRTVLEDLVAEPVLAPATYAICHYDSPDERGIDVALLYRPDKFHLQGSKAIPTNTENPTRDILTVWGTIDNEHIFAAIVHWPSRIGGVKFTEPQRIACAEQLRTIVDSVLLHNPATKIIIMGDMNDNPRNKSIAKTLRAKRKTKNLTHADLYTPFGNTKRGSSVYDDKWNHYDNIILSGNLLRGAGLQLCTTNKNAGHIFSHPDLLDKRGYPMPTYRGTEYIGGVSDHLPIYIIIGK
ncbi:MAG: endonuclease/exonuclease/phosphatase family protein [Alistipes sp.]|nr:endonuclease/exonuclease/phosphatase family protein [Alistipes sp.]